MEGRKIGMSGNEISKLGGYAPILLGGFMLYSACFRRSWGKGKRFPVTWYMRLFAGGMGFLLWFFWYSTRIFKVAHHPVIVPLALVGFALLYFASQYWLPAEA